MTEGGEVVSLRKAAEREMMMLMRDLRGRCAGGMESQVRRPMRTALIGGLSSLVVGVWGEVVVVGWGVGDGGGVLEVEGRRGGGRFVTRAKKARSAFKGGQGRVPRRPMPREGVVATMRVRGGRGGIDVVGGVVGIMTIEWERKWGELYNHQWFCFLVGILSI